MDAGTLKYIILLLAGYPLAYVFAKLPSVTAKHLYSCLIGLWMMQVRAVVIMLDVHSTRRNVHGMLAYWLPESCSRL
jgi:ABC-type spermidine/putrescine transport system permease subunit I